MKGFRTALANIHHLFPRASVPRGSRTTKVRLTRPMMSELAQPCGGPREPSKSACASLGDGLLRAEPMRYPPRSAWADRRTSMIRPGPGPRWRGVAVANNRRAGLHAGAGLATAGFRRRFRGLVVRKRHRDIDSTAPPAGDARRFPRASKQCSARSSRDSSSPPAFVIGRRRDLRQAGATGRTSAHSTSSARTQPRRRGGRARTAAWYEFAIAIPAQARTASAGSPACSRSRRVAVTSPG